MPTYGYRCSVCAHEFERVQKMTDAPLTECESCGGAVKKMIFPVGIAFKGTGFYVTDYKGSAEKKAQSADAAPANADASAKSDTKSDGGDSVKTETKTETKSETKSETKPESKSEAPKSDTKAATGKD